MKFKFAFVLLAMLAGALMARTTTVGVGETVPVGGTTTVTTTTTTTPGEEATDEGVSSDPIHQVGITPADGSEAPPAEGSEWGDLGIVEGGDSESPSAVAAEAGEADGQPQPDGNGENRTGSGCAPALVLAGLALALFARG